MNTETKNAIIDLQRFCWADDYREYLRQPWPHKGWMYASNGHILVRVPAPEQADAVFPHKVGDSAANMLANVGERSYAPLPPFELGRKCSLCHGTGKRKLSNCPDCEGGKFTHGRHEYECKECEGEGVIEDSEGEERECYICEGHGTESKCITLPGGAGYQARYLQLIKDLPGLLLSPGDTADVAPAKAAHFTFDGGEGLLMPMRNF